MLLGWVESVEEMWVRGRLTFNFFLFLFLDIYMPWGHAGCALHHHQVFLSVCYRNVLQCQMFLCELETEMTS